MGKLIIKTDEFSRKIWDAIADIAREVETWPEWKKGGTAPLVSPQVEKPETDPSSL